jgi:predicted DNA binding CopG/RHH family protein
MKNTLELTSEEIKEMEEPEKYPVDCSDIPEIVDFSKAVRNPYAKKLKKQVTVSLSPMTIDYFKKQSEETGIPYKTLMNLYLEDCVKNNRKLNINRE